LTNKVIAIIPARGGSKGLPGKNIKKLIEKPLIAYTIEAALNAKCIDRVVISTDDSEIAKVALAYKAEVPFMRPSVLATDTAMAIDVYLDTIAKIEAINKIKIENIIILLPTCPLRTAEDIDNAYRLFIEKDADSVISYTRESHPVTWHKYLDNENKFIDILEPDLLKNRQDLRVSYFPNGAIYIFKTELLKSGKYYNENSFAYVMEREKSVDIDTLDDFLYAEFLLRKRISGTLLK